MKLLSRLAGPILTLIGLLIFAPTQALAQSYIGQWGSTGTGPGQFRGTRGVAVDATGAVYVVDNSNYRIQKFSSTGTYLTEWGSGDCDLGHFVDPVSIAVGAGNQVYVGDAYCRVVQIFTSEGAYVGEFGAQGPVLPWVGSPGILATDALGYVYTGYGDGFRKWTSTGTYVGQGGELGQLTDDMAGLAIDASGTVYASIAGLNRIKVYTSAGDLVTEWSPSDGGVGAIAIDASGLLYIEDRQNGEIRVFTGSGSLVTQFGSSGSGDGQFQCLWGLAVGSAGIYVPDCELNRVQHFGSLATASTSSTWGQVKVRYR